LESTERGERHRGKERIEGRGRAKISVHGAGHKDALWLSFGVMPWYASKKKQQKFKVAWR
jgi:hypothetical protein